MHLLRAQASPGTAKEVLRRWGDVVALWRSILSLCHSLDYATAMEYMPSLEADITAFADHTRDLLAQVGRPVRARARAGIRSDQIRSEGTMGAGEVCVGGWWWWWW